jgi:hypothetical protein
MYYYTNPITHFLAPGNDYTYEVFEGDGVPSLNAVVFYPLCTPYITSPAPYAWVDMSNGFDLEWSHSCGGKVTLVIMDLNADSTGVYIVTDDDGAHPFTAGDLSIIDPVAYQFEIQLITQNRQPLLAAGYDPRSFLWARTVSTQIIYRQP